MKRQQAELLAPAGSYESMVAAIAAGADAVYIGGNRFGARAYADNLDEERMLEAIDYAHLHGCKLYMTVNTLVKEDELSGLFSYLNPYYKRGLDAVIVQDLGVFAYIRKHFPELPIHASTQMTITGPYGAKVLADLGASRIVTARELSLEEIAEIRDQADVEIESFVHGALCYCYSGQCLFSSLIGGRSGNRGRCAQPCRLPYEVKRDNRVLNKKDETYLLSLKDLCTLDIIPDMIEAGVYSMKIEGRMKSPRYTAGVVSVYRKYVDLYLNHGRAGYRVEQKDRQMLQELFDRGGFTEGYYTQHNGESMTARKEKPAFRQGNEELFRYLDETYIEKKNQIHLDGEVLMKAGEPVTLKLSCKGVSAEVQGVVPEPAQKQPITEEKLVRQMRKTGNTAFVFEHLKAVVEGDVFLPVQALNELRRDGLAALEEAMLKPFYREQPLLASVTGRTEIVTEDVAAGRKLHVLLEQPKGLESVLAISQVSEVMLEADGFAPKEWKRTVDLCHKAEKSCILALPPIFRTDAVAYFDRNLELMNQAGFDGVLIRSLEEVEYLREKQVYLPMIFDHNLYSFNHEAAQMLERLGADRLTLPLELNSRELEQVGCQDRELIAYGYLPMMVSAQCIKKTTEGCDKKPELLWLKDRMGKHLPVKNHCAFCYNTIFNISPLSLLGQESLLARLAPSAIRLQFTLETPEEIRTITDAFADMWMEGKAVVSPLKDFTRGHFKRGVE